jgi:hypothetical protein
MEQDLKKVELETKIFVAEIEAQGCHGDEETGNSCSTSSNSAATYTASGYYAD